MSGGKIWTPDAKLSKPPTFTSHTIGGLELQVMDDAPPETVGPIPPQNVGIALAVFGTQLQAVLREIVELRAAIESLEADEPRGPYVSHHSHHEPGEPGDE